MGESSFGEYELYNLNKRIMSVCAGGADSADLGNIALQIISIRTGMKREMVREPPAYKRTEIEEKLSRLQELEKSLVSLYLRSKIKSIQNDFPRYGYKGLAR